MRLHLPKRLLHAVLTALVTTPAALFTLGSSAYAGVSGVNFYTNTSEDNSAASMVDYASFGDGKYTYVNTDPEGKTAVTTIKPGDSLSGTITVLNVASDKVLNIVTNSESSTSKLFTNLSIESINVADSGTAKLVIDGAQVVSIGGAIGTVNFEAKSGGEAQLIFDGSGNYGTYATIGTSDNYDRKLSVTNSSIVNFTTITNSWGMGAIEVETNSQLTATTISFKSGDKRSGDGQGGKITGAGTVKVGTFETGNVGNYTVNVGKFEVTTINAACAADKTLTLSSANLTVGTLNQTQGKVVLDSANAAISNLLFNGGTLTNSGTLRITGKFKGGTLTNTGTITFASGCVIDISGMTFETRFFDSAESDGYVDCHVAHLVVSGTTAINQGVIIKNGDTEVANASFDGSYVHDNTAEKGYLLMDNDLYDTSTLKNGDGAEGSVGVASGASYLKIASGKTLTVNSTDWTLDQIYGEGNVSIASNLEYSAGPSKATGRLDIASGVQLTIGGGTVSNANLNSFTSIDIDGGTLKLNFKQGTFNNVTVSANGGTINFYDSGSATTQQTFAGTTTLNGKLNIQSGYKVLANFQNVTGSGEVSITGYVPYYPHEAATYNFALQNTYTGTIDLDDSLATVNVSGTLGAATLKKTSGVALNYSGAEINGATLDAVTLTKSDGYVTVTGASTIKNIINRTSGNANGYAMVVANGGSLSVQGINDFTATTTSGDTLTSYSGLVGVVNGGSLTVEEDAVLKVKGLFNSRTHTSNGDVTVKAGGALTVVGSTSETYVVNLTIGGSGEKTTAATFDGKLNVNSTLSIASGGSVETKGTSTIATLTGSGTLKASNGTAKVTDASAFTGTLEATGGTLTASGVSSLASMTATGATTLNAKGVTEYDSANGTGGLSLSELVIGAGSTVQAWGTGDTWTKDAEATVLMRGSENTSVTLTVGTAGQTGTSTLNANLVLDGATVTLNNALTMGSTLTLNNVNLINWDDLVAANAGGDPIVLFTSVDSLTLGSGDSAVEAEVGTEYAASKAFSNTNMGNYKLQMVGTAGDYTVQMVQNAPTPEPTTATLSLLALMGLAARRRRKA